ncbi:MAG TPA: DUF5671 domain-containing protein [Candidatus Paceibacterota bacterium]
METAPVAPAAITTKTTPRDFFLWAGAVVALYGSVIAFIALLFEYINRAFPDPLAGYADIYGGSVRFSMATLIVLVPTMLALLRIIRKTIEDEPVKAHIWIRKWALVLTIFVAGSAIIIELVNIINTFLGGELTTRFILKAGVILLVAFGFAYHFIRDLRGYWIDHPKQANVVGIATAILAVAVVIAGFFIIGTPNEMRMLRSDNARVGDLQSIQYQVVDYWQQKEKLPESLDVLQNPLTGFELPTDPETGTPYRYEVTDDLSFKLCATFGTESVDTKGQGSYPEMGYRGDTAVSYPGKAENQNWQHGAGEACFERTIDPDMYPPYPKPL